MRTTNKGNTMAACVTFGIAVFLLLWGWFDTDEQPLSMVLGFGFGAIFLCVGLLFAKYAIPAERAEKQWEKACRKWREAIHEGKD